MISVEVCTGSIKDSITAWKAGASRLELNSGLETGGLTPSPGVVREVISQVGIPVMVMIRPRSGDFVYSPSEKRAILHDIEVMLDIGASGVVFGSLLPDGSIDCEMTGLVRLRVGRKKVVFHRAFDLTPCSTDAAAVLAGLGVDRILSSGGKATAWEGRGNLRKLVESIGSDIEILPGSGINSSNVLALVKHTGCSWVHGTFSGGVVPGNQGILPPGSPGVSAREVETVVKLLGTV